MSGINDMINKRTFYAGLAMHGIATAYKKMSNEDLAKYAFELADEMIKQEDEMIKQEDDPLKIVIDKME